MRTEQATEPNPWSWWWWWW